MSRTVPERLEYLACRFNTAHRGMGTELLSVGEGKVTLRVPWREDLIDGHGGLSGLVVTVLLDHACALAALVHLGDEQRMGSTVDLRVDHLGASAPGRGVSAVAVACPSRGDLDTVRVRGQAFDPEDPQTILAIATSTLSVAR